MRGSRGRRAAKKPCGRVPPAQPAAQFEAMIRIRSSDSVGSCRDESAVPNVDHARSDGGRQRQPICSAAPQPVDGAKGSAHLRPAIGKGPAV